MARVTVTADLQRRMARETARSALQQRSGVIALAIGAVLLVGGLLLLALESRAGGTSSDAVFITLLGAFFLVVLPLSTLRSSRRIMATTMPVGSEVGITVTPDGISSDTVRGTATIAWSAYRSARVGTDVVVLPVTGSRILSVVPRAALTDEDVAVLRQHLPAR